MSKQTGNDDEDIAGVPAEREDVEGMVDPEEKIPADFVFHSQTTLENTSLNLSNLDPSDFQNMISNLGGVPPLSPLSQTSQYYTGPDSEQATSEGYSTADTSWQSLQSETGVEFGLRGSGDGRESQDSETSDVGARPKSKHHMTRQMRKKKREELKKGQRCDDEDLVSELQLLALGEKSREPPVTGTGFYYEDILTSHKNEWDPHFPECPERISEPFSRCVELGLVDRCVRIERTYGTEHLIGYQHSEDFLEKMKSSVEMTHEELRTLSRQYDSVYFNNMSYECALISLGGAVELVRMILQRKIKNGFALIRPPGHHAEQSSACGYCMFNNVAIATKMALEEMGLQRVLIVDWDVHHGQGTQYMFYDDPRVLYFSIHRYEYGEYWPNLRQSDYDFIGEGEGKGYNINVPLNKTGMTNSDYIAIFQQILLPVAYEYCPQLVLISAGFDAALGCPEFSPEFVIISAGMDCAVEDPKGEMTVTPACFPHLLHMVSSLAEGRVGVILEGGYCLPSLSEGVALTLRELLGDPCPSIGHTVEPCQSVTESILNVIKVLQLYWKCFKYQEEASTFNPCPYPEVNLLPPKPDIVFSTTENKPDTYLSDDYPEQTATEKESVKKKVDELIASTSLKKAETRTCLVFDADMRAHKNAVSSSHPERPDRISRIFDLHVKWGLYEKCSKVQAREATDEELTLIHRSDYVDGVKEMMNMSPRDLYQLQDSYNSVYLCQSSNRCARLATGGTLNAVEAVLSGKAQSGVAIVRPPGHHAESHTAMGFCFFNTIAIAAKYAQKQFGIKRVLILDWDVHHGNGTQHVFDSDPSVLFISLHRYDHGFFYPCSEDASHEIVGFGAGEGFNVNIPWNIVSMGDSEYITAFLQIVMPIAYEFDPELVLVSAGFDAARGDPLGRYDITSEGYAHMTHMLMSLANGKVVLVLEGGYNLTSISTSMASCTAVLLGESPPLLPPLDPCSSAVSTIQDVIETHKKYWKSLKFAVPIPYTALPADPAKKDELQDDSKDLSSTHSHTSSISELHSGLQNMSLQDEKLPQKKAISDPSDVKGQGSDAPVDTSTDTTDTSLGACGGSDSTQDVLEMLSQQGYDQMYAVQPAPWCPHLDTMSPLPARGLQTLDPCEQCGNVSENWVCLVCYKVLCSRFVNEHMLFHGVAESHLMVLSYADLSVWCYACDTYVDNPVLQPAKSSAHMSKFGTPLLDLANT